MKIRDYWDKYIFWGVIILLSWLLFFKVLTVAEFGILITNIIAADRLQMDKKR